MVLIMGRVGVPNLLVQPVSASVTDTKFRLGELGVGSDPCPVDHRRDYHHHMMCIKLRNVLYLVQIIFFLSEREIIGICYWT